MSGGKGKRRPTLAELGYEPHAPLCGNCAHHFTAKRGTVDESGRPRIMCGLALQPVRVRGNCDRWLGYDGTELDE